MTRWGRNPLMPAAGADRAGDLREDVERETVAGMLERAVPCRIDRLEALPGVLGAGDVGVDLHDDRSALDADALRRHADPCIAAPEDLLVRSPPLGIGVDPAAHVEPLDDDRAAELRRVRRPAHEHTRAVRRGRVRRERPPTVAVSGPVARYDVAVPDAAYSACS